MKDVILISMVGLFVQLLPALFLYDRYLERTAVPTPDTAPVSASLESRVEALEMKADQLDGKLDALLQILNNGRRK